MDRREFLKGSVFAASAGLALDACAPEASQLIPILVPEEPFVPGEETWTRSTCFECPSSCGIEIRKIDGRLVKVEGNPEQPMSRGGLCARGQASPQAMYHPDRVRSPLIKRDDGSWAELDWDDALDRVASHLSGIDDIAFLTGALTGHRREMVQRFLKAFGSSNHIVHEPFSTAPVARAHELVLGRPGVPHADIENANYVVSLGAELLESYVSPVRFGRGLAELRQGRPGRRGKFVMVGPRLSLTAANADEWIPVRPSEEVEMALAIAHVLMRDRLHDELEADGLERFRSVVEAIEPSATAERLAHEMAEHQPTIVIAGGSESGLPLALAVSHLNVLLGNQPYAAPPPPFALWPDLDGPESVSTPLTKALSSDSPSVLFVADTNPVHTLPPSYDIDSWLASIRFHVSFSTFLDETSAMADLVLPESMSFERFEDAVPVGAPVPMATLAQPLLVRPLYDTRSMPDALIQIAKRSDRGEGFSWSSYEAALRDAWSGLDVPWSDALAIGGFWGEDSSEEQGRYGFETAPLEERTRIADDLELHVYASNAFGDGRSAHLPFLQELSDPITGVRWGSVLEIATVRADELAITSGDRVEVSSDVSSLVATAHVTPGIHPDVVAIAAGQGHTSYGRYARGRGVNAYRLLKPADDENGLLLGGTTVTVKKA